MTANYSKSYLSYLNKLVDHYNNTYDRSIVIWLKKLRPILKLLSLKLMIDSEPLSIKIFLVKITLKIIQE